MGRSANVEVVAVAYLNSSLEPAVFEFVWPRIRLSGGAPYYEGPDAADGLDVVAVRAEDVRGVE